MLNKQVTSTFEYRSAWGHWSLHLKIGSSDKWYVTTDSEVSEIHWKTASDAACACFDRKTGIAYLDKLPKDKHPKDLSKWQATTKKP